MRQRDPAQRPGGDGLVFGGEPAHADRPVLGIETDQPAPDDIHRGMILKEIDLALEPLGMHQVIGIHARDVLPCGQPHNLVEARTEAVVLPVHQGAHARVPQPPQQFGAAIGRSVVYGDQLPIGQCLREDASQRVLDEWRGVIDRQPDSDGRFH